MLPMTPTGGDTSGDLEIDPKCPLYRRLSIYFPGIARPENGQNFRVSLTKVIEIISGEEPSKLRYFLFRVGWIKE
jgi:hypothetical protein